MLFTISYNALNHFSRRQKIQNFYVFNRCLMYLNILFYKQHLCPTCCHSKRSQETNRSRLDSFCTLIWELRQSSFYFFIVIQNEQVVSFRVREILSRPCIQNTQLWQTKLFCQVEQFINSHMHVNNPDVLRMWVSGYSGFKFDLENIIQILSFSNCYFCL